MGKFNWRAGLALASAGMRQDLERKRAYERDDEKNAMAMSMMLAQQGMPIPENVMMKMGPMTRELMPQLEQAIKSGKEKEFEDWLNKKYYGAQIEQLYAKPEKLTGKAATMQQIENEPWYQAMSPEEQMKIRKKVLMGGNELADAITALTQQKKEQDFNKGQYITPPEAAATGLPMGTTFDAMIKSGAFSVPPEKRETLSEFDTALATVDQLEFYANKMNTESDLAKAKWKGLGDYLKGISGYDPNAAMLLRQKTKLPLLARALGNKGAMATYDTEQVKPLVDIMGETKELTTANIAELRRMFTTNKENYIKTLTTPITKPSTTPAKNNITTKTPSDYLE